MPEILDPEVHFDLSNVFQSLADYELKRETTGRRCLFATQKSLNKINELCNLAMEHRYPLAECGFLRPMQEILSQLIEMICQGIEAHGDEAEHTLAAMKEINDLVEKTAEEHERRKRFRR